MLDYKKPQHVKELEIDEKIKIPPSCYWNNDYDKPDITKWKGNSEQSAARNLILLLFFYFDVPTKETAELMDLTPSRVRGIQKNTKLKLFGTGYQPSSDILVRNYKYSRPPCPNIIRKYEDNKPEIAAIFNTLNSIAIWFDNDMFKLYHFSIIYLEKAKGGIDYKQYNGPWR